MLGSFLACLFVGLRFSDLQRISWRSIVFDYKTVRGTCWRTKTSSSGQPFGFHCHGFLSTAEHSWAFKWVEALDASGYMHQSTDLSMPCPDFFPAMDSLGLEQPLQPMSYARALKLLRWCSRLPWKSVQQEFGGNITLHSLKTTMLSWGTQVADSAKISLEERQTQGHHRLHGESQSVILYGRDDFQAKLVKGVRMDFVLLFLNTGEHNNLCVNLRSANLNVWTSKSRNMNGNSLISSGCGFTSRHRSGRR